MTFCKSLSLLTLSINVLSINLTHSRDKQMTMSMSIFVNKEQITQVIEELQYFKSLFYRMCFGKECYKVTFDKNYTGETVDAIWELRQYGLSSYKKELVIN